MGWRGPYLLTGNVINGTLHGSFGTVFDPASPATTAYVHVDITTDTGSQVFDGWHRPVILQIPYFSGALQPEYARLVSAGPGSGLGSGDAAIDTTIQSSDASNRGDDRVLFLKIPDPGNNNPVMSDNSPNWPVLILWDINLLSGRRVLPGFLRT